MSRNKFGAVKTTVDGITFDSKLEAKRYGELKLLLKAGKIFALELQPEYPIVVETPSGEVVIVGVYKADFRYKHYVNGLATPATQIEDTKGMKTPVYRLKKKLVEAQRGITITEITR